MNTQRCPPCGYKSVFAVLKQTRIARSDTPSELLASGKSARPCICPNHKRQIWNALAVIAPLGRVALPRFLWLESDLLLQAGPWAAPKIAKPPFLKPSRTM